jgi:hypothetical protein
MPVSLQFETSDFDKKSHKMDQAKLEANLKTKLGIDYTTLPEYEKKRIAHIVTEMRLSMKETCRKVTLADIAIAWVFVRYKHDPADQASIEERLLNPSAATAAAAEESATAEVKPKKKGFDRFESPPRQSSPPRSTSGGGASASDVAEMKKDIKEIKEMLTGHFCKKIATKHNTTQHKT